MSWLSGLRDLFRTIDGPLQVEQKRGAAIEDLKARVGRLESGEQVPVADAKAAASAAASAVAAQHIGELARRLGVMEEQLRSRRSPGHRRRLTED